MRDHRDAKAMAKSLRQALAARDIAITHSESLELIAKTFGFDNWNILAARIGESGPLAAANACSFCGKRQDEVRQLVAGQGGFICEECVLLSFRVVRQGHLDRRRREPANLP